MVEQEYREAGRHGNRAETPTIAGKTNAMVTVDMYTVYVYTREVINSFADPATEDIYNGTNSKAARRIDRRVWPIIARKLDFLNAATSLNDFKSPGNQLEKLRDDLAGYWSVRVNDQYRIIFRMVDGSVMDVSCRDIH